MNKNTLTYDGDTHIVDCCSRERGNRIVSRGQTIQTAYFSFDMGAEKNKGLAYYRYMFCAENCQILAIVVWLKIGVNSLQRPSNDAYKLL